MWKEQTEEKEEKIKYQPTNQGFWKKERLILIGHFGNSNSKHVGARRRALQRGKHVPPKNCNGSQSAIIPKEFCFSYVAIFCTPRRNGGCSTRNSRRHLEIRFRKDLDVHFKARRKGRCPNKRLFRFLIQCNFTQNIRKGKVWAGLETIKEPVKIHFDVDFIQKKLLNTFSNQNITREFLPTDSLNSRTTSGRK